MTSEIVKLLIFLWIFLYPLSDQSVIIAVFAIDIAVLWLWQYLLREVFIPNKIKSTVTQFTQTVIHNVSLLKLSDGSPLHVVFTSKETEEQESVVKHLVELDKQLIVGLQIYKESDSGYQPMDLTTLPSDILDGVNNQLKLLNEEISKLINFGKRSLEYSDRLFSWIKFIGVLVSFNIMGKLLTYL